jgi:antitoxin component YwqK of YwqJK toxin-antitoxin module
MMLKSNLLVANILVVTLCFAQQYDTLYFDAKNQKCDIDSAEYYSVGQRQNGKWNGQVISFFLTGEKKQMSFYNSSGKLIGEKTSYFKNGNVSEIETLIDGKDQGIKKEFYENGQLMQVMLLEFVEGERFVTSSTLIDFYDQEGNQTASKGKGIVVRFHKNGETKEKGAYDEGQKSGAWMFYHDNGQLDELGSFENGKRIGEWKGFYEDGSEFYTESYSKPGELISGVSIDKEGEQHTECKFFIPTSLKI